MIQDADMLRHYQRVATEGERILHEVVRWPFKAAAVYMADELFVIMKPAIRSVHAYNVGIPVSEMATYLDTTGRPTIEAAMQARQWLADMGRDYDRGDAVKLLEILVDMWPYVFNPQPIDHAFDAQDPLVEGYVAVDGVKREFLG